MIKGGGNQSFICLIEGYDTLNTKPLQARYISGKRNSPQQEKLKMKIPTK